jgi:FMN phosphatase YigB (HAD superfamily)
MDRQMESGAALWGAYLSTLPDAPDAVILSFEVGLVKPDPAIFHLVCDGER